MEQEVSYRRSFWISSLITMVGLALFIVISAVLPSPASSAGVVLLGVFLALVPALIWMTFFYQQDRAEPEPKRLVARMFVFGALAAAAAIPFASYVLGHTIDVFSGLVVRLILTTLTIALMQETLKVAMVRYVVLGTTEFDRHPDGIVYGMASGLGFATILNVAYVLQSGGVLPLAGAIYAVDNALIQGVLGAISGYYIGRVKIDGKSLGWMTQGLAIVTVINGIYQVASGELSNRLSFNPWYGLAVAVVLAVVAGAVLFAFFRRALRRAVGDLTTISITAHARSKDMPWDIRVRYDWLLIGALALAVAVGLGSGALVRSRMVAYSSSSVPVDFRYPAGWASDTGDASSFAIRDLTVRGVFKPSITVIDEKDRLDSSLDLRVAERIATISYQRNLFVELSRDSGLTVGGQPAIRSVYQYAASTGAGPAVVSGVETYVQVGGRMITFRLEAEPEDFDASRVLYDRLLRSVQFTVDQ